MRTKLIIAGIILAGATTAFMMAKKDKPVQAVNSFSTSQGISPIAYDQKEALKKVNPAHGMPGHRCDLAVGAPLPTAGSAAPAAALPTINMTPQQPTVVKVNPAHGMPGHRCDLQVGAPL